MNKREYGTLFFLWSLILFIALLEGDTFLGRIAFSMTIIVPIFLTLALNEERIVKWLNDGDNNDRD